MSAEGNNESLGYKGNATTQFTDLPNYGEESDDFRPGFRLKYLVSGGDRYLKSHRRRPLPVGKYRLLLNRVFG